MSPIHRGLFADRRGTSAVEYALILFAILLVVAGGYRLLGEQNAKTSRATVRVLQGGEGVASGSGVARSESSSASASMAEASSAPSDNGGSTAGAPQVESKVVLASFSVPSPPPVGGPGGPGPLAVAGGGLVLTGGAIAAAGLLPDATVIGGVIGVPLNVAGGAIALVGGALVGIDWLMNSGPLGPSISLPSTSKEGTPPPNLSPEGARRQGALNEAKRNNDIPVSSQPEKEVPNVDRRGNPQPGRQYVYRDSKGNEVIIRDDSGGHDFGAGDPQNRGPHFNDPAGNHYDY